MIALALDDRQRALDDRRLETMREEAIHLKRRFFLVCCTATKDDIK